MVRIRKLWFWFQVLKNYLKAPGNTQWGRSKLLWDSLFSEQPDWSKTDSPMMLYLELIDSTRNQNNSLSSLGLRQLKLIPHRFKKNKTPTLHQWNLLHQNNCNILSREHANKLKKCSFKFSKLKFIKVWWPSLEVQPKINFLLHTLFCQHNSMKTTLNNNK